MEPMSPRESLATPAARAAYVAHHADDLLRRVLGPQPTPHAQATAEDALQDLLVDLARPGSWAPDQPEQLLGFAVRTLRLLNAGLIREQSAAQIVPFAADHEAVRLAADPADLLATRSEALAQVRGALDRLPSPRARRIALLHLIAGDRRTVAARVGTTPRAVRTCVERFRLASATKGARSGRAWMSGAVRSGGHTLPR